MQTLTNNQKIHYSLRVAAAMCFIGHGAFGIITKAIWCNYFAVFGIDKVHAYQLMPVLGTIDIMLGLLLLFKPVRAIAVWLVVWAIITAACRPIFWRIHRAGRELWGTARFSGFGGWHHVESPLAIFYSRSPGACF
jgi:hypothetical protein